MKKLFEMKTLGKSIKKTIKEKLMQKNGATAWEVVGSAVLGVVLLGVVYVAFKVLIGTETTGFIAKIGTSLTSLFN